MLIKTLNVSNVHHFHSSNLARLDGEYGSQAQLVALAASLARNGWDPQQGNILAREIGKDEVELAVQERTQEWERLKDGVDGFEFTGPDGKSTVTGKDLLHAFEELYVQKGKVIKPTHVGLTCNRRAFVMVMAQAMANRIAEWTGCGVVTTDIRTFTDRLDQAEAVLGENAKAVHAVRPGLYQQLLAAEKLIDYGASEGRIRSMPSIGSGQKVYAFCILSNAAIREGLPSLIKRAGLASDDDNYINVSKLDQKVLREAVKDFQSGALSIEEAIEKALNVKGSKAAPMMKRSDVESLRGSKNGVIGQVADAILTKDASKLESLMNHSEAINLAIRLIQAGKLTLETLKGFDS